MEENEVRTYILEHLNTQPQAGDTLEGITRWWLVSQRINNSVIAVKEALSQLQAEGLITERKITGGKPVYLAGNIEA